MAHLDSTRPPESENEQPDVLASSRKVVKKAMGLPSVTIDPFKTQIERVLGGPGDINNDMTNPAEKESPLMKKDFQIADFHKKIDGLGLPTHFVEEELDITATPLEYYRLLSQLVDLVLFHAQHHQNVSPIGLARRELNRHARETAKIFINKPASLDQLLEIAQELHQLIDVMAK